MQGVECGINCDKDHSVGAALVRFLEPWEKPLSLPQYEYNNATLIGEILPSSICFLFNSIQVCASPRGPDFAKALSKAAIVGDYRPHRASTFAYSL